MSRSPPDPDTIAVVTINWNGWPHTLACLHALRAGEGAAFHLYIVDNASGDDSLERLADLGADVTLLPSPVNAGWAGGNNLGIRRALADGFQHVFLLNNDAFVRRDTLAVLLRQRHESGAAMPVLGPIEMDASGGGYGFIGAEHDAETGLPEPIPIAQASSRLADATFETAYICGAALFAGRAHFERVGLLDERFYLNYDETDWCYRARGAGYSLRMVRDAVVNHVGSASIGGSHSPLQTYFMSRNAPLFFEKHAGWTQWRGLLRQQIDLAHGACRVQTNKIWPLLFLLDHGPCAAAFRLGVRDYALRRFGDCPPIVRQWHAQRR